MRADPQLYKGTAFPEKERDAFHLHGLLPPHVSTLEEQISRALQSLRQLETDLERHAFLRELQDTKEILFYQGLFLGIPHQSRPDQILAHPCFDGVEAIVVTDGERILGLDGRGRHGQPLRQARALFLLRRPESRDHPADPA